jgi:predicted transcriptional regulator
MSVNGLNLRKLRQAVGIGQVELAKRVGVTQGMISQLEVGTRSCRPDTLELIAAELRCSVEDLTGQPAVWISFMRNCKRLSHAQLEAINEVVFLLVKCSPAEIIEAASTSTNKCVMQCADCWNCLTVCKKGYQLDNKPCGDYEPRKA